MHCPRLHLTLRFCCSRRRHGRCATMLLGGVCFLLGATLTSTATHLPQLVIGRIVLGLGVGASTLQHEQDYLLKCAVTLGHALCPTESVGTCLRQGDQRPAISDLCKAVSEDELGQFVEGLQDMHWACCCMRMHERPTA